MASDETVAEEPEDVPSVEAHWTPRHGRRQELVSMGDVYSIRLYL